MTNNNHSPMIRDYKIRFFISSSVTIPIIFLSPMIQQIFGIKSFLSPTLSLPLLFVFSSFIFFYGGWPFLKGLYSELSQKNPGMMTLIALAITVSYAYSTAIVFGLTGKPFFWELATLIDIMLLGHWIEMKSVMGAGKALEQLTKLIPDKAHKIIKPGQIEDVLVSSLQTDDNVLVKPGEKIPTDGVIIEGASYLDESLLTGESKPVKKEIGDVVIGGALNVDGSLTIKIQKIGDQTFISNIIKLVKEAQASKSHTQDLANKAAFWLTIIALCAGTLTFFVWAILTSQSLAFALERTVTVMVITCPHALGLAVPLVVAVSTTLAAKNGLLIRNRTTFEQARNVQAVVFDKTGTLTQGSFGITNTIIFDKNNSKEKLLQLAASIEFHSEHPLAQAIVKSTEQKLPVQEFKALRGKGAQGKIDGKLIQIVSPGYLTENNIAMDNIEIEKLQSEGKTVVFILSENKLQGAIALADLIRPESKQAIAALKSMGIRCIMLTGDNKQVASWVAQKLGLDEVIAEVLPEQKAETIKKIQQRGLTVAMTGDGINDAPALAQADIGIAIGAGTDVAIETADIILIKSNPLDVVAIVKLARATYQKMIENLLWATGYNALSIPLAAGALYSFGIILSPAIGAILMSASTVVCALNAKLLKI